MKSTRVFHDFARWVYEERPKPTFREFVLQHTFVDSLQRTLWSGVSGKRLKSANSRTADIVLLDLGGGSACFAVELKNCHELQRSHSDQAKRYSEDHNAPCVLTNGLEYRVVLSLSEEHDFKHGGVAGRRADHQSMEVRLGEIDPLRFHDALERQLQELFVAAANGMDEVQAVLAVLSKGTGRAQSRNLLRETRNPRELSDSSKAADEFQVLFGEMFGDERNAKSTKRGRSDRDVVPATELPFMQFAPSFKTNSAVSVARALKRELKGMDLTVSEDSSERATLCLGRLHIVRITEFQMHCRISVRQPEDKAPRGTDVTEKGWRTETFASRDDQAIQDAASLIRKLWDR